MKKPAFSLIVATLANKGHMKALLSSLAQQTYTDFEVVIVDQTKPKYLDSLINSFKKKLSITYIFAEKKGLSLARNKGLQIAKGQIVSFPDDDCTYTPETLQQVNSIFEQNNRDFIGVRIEEHKTNKVAAGGNQTTITKINYFNFPAVASAGIFVRRKIIDQISAQKYKQQGKYFDENMGVGARFPSGEETDLLFRALHQGVNIYFHPDVKIYHPLPPVQTASYFTKRIAYGRGWGYLFYKHIFVLKKPICLLVFFAVISYAKLMIVKYSVLANFTQAKLFWGTLKGIIVGFWEAHNGS